MDVGRQRQDFNGDGYADLAVVASGRGSPPYNAVMVFYGGSSMTTSSTPNWRVNGTAGAVGYAFRQVLWAGDMNGDGYSDLAVTLGRDSGDAVRIYVGSDTPVADPAIELSEPASDAKVESIQAPGDLNGDGFADLFEIWSGKNVDGGFRHTYLSEYGGNPVIVGGTEVVADNDSAIACDLDSDGFGDLVVESGSGAELLPGGPAGVPVDGPALPLAVPGGPVVACLWNANGSGGESLLFWESGRQLALLSSDVPPSSGTCDGAFPAVPATIASGGASAGVDDADGDGYTDAVVGDYPNNRAFVFFGGCPATRTMELPGLSDHTCTAASGYAVGSVGDMDGDGYPEIVVGNPYIGIDGLCAGEVYVYAGGPTLSAVPALVVSDPDTPAPGDVGSDGFGASVD